MITRKAKIVGTIGPSSWDEDTLRRLINAGLNVARLNFSHGSHQDHAAVIERLRKLSEEMDQPISILQDLQGPKLRVGALPKEGVPLKAGQTLVLTSAEEMDTTAGDDNRLVLPMDVPDLVNSLSPGNRILMDDGHMELQVTAVRPDAVEARVVLGGVLKSHKGVNMPGANIQIPGFTEKDREDLEFGLEQGVDYVAISFVHTAEDVQTVRQAIRAIAPDKTDTPIIAKLERPEAIDHLEEILDAADGVMVARGDLGVETSPAAVPIIQKKIIEAANKKTRIVITATQMLDSMIHNPRPTRAEASDVANAIFDGTDAVMLSGETASGDYPVESVTMMDTIVSEAEAHFDEWGHCETFDLVTNDDALSITRAARELAHDRNVSYIAVFTQTGRTAELMAKARPQVPILAFTPETRTLHRLNLLWGVIPILVPYAYTVETMISIVEEAMRTYTPLQEGQQVIIITGLPVGAWRPANIMLLHTIGEPMTPPYR
jgi:pyruvate kinase